MLNFAVLVASTCLYLLFPLIAHALPAAQTLSANNARPTVKIDSGVVIGINKTENSTHESLTAYLGIPFAAKPVRWAPPKRPTPWKTPFDASKYGPACIQQFNYPEPRRSLITKWFNTPAPQESEDCLSACVYVPLSDGNATKKAVMVWLYGGGLLYGSNAMPLYDGSVLAANEDVIVVVVNYRTNVFGFPGSPQVPVAQSNPGWLDQRFALDWVQRNIAAFGGDPDKVTIFGESAGAQSVDALVTQPPNPLPFRAAIMESGTATYNVGVANHSVAWDTLVAAMNCSHAKDILRCMRTVPASKLKSYNELNRLPWTPVRDNVTYALTARSNRLNSTTQSPKIARVPVLGGSNADEGRLYSISANDSSTFLRGLLPTATDQQIAGLLSAYPIANPPTAPYLTSFSNSFEQLGAIYTDIVFQCPARLLHQETSKAGIQSWRYYYNASFPNTNWFPDAGAYHSSEIGLVLGSYPLTNTTIFQEALSRYMQYTWASFARDPHNFNGWKVGANATGVIGGGVRAEGGMKATGIYLNVLNGNETETDIDRRCSLYEGIYATS